MTADQPTNGDAVTGVGMRDGAKTVLPILVGVIPFGFIIGLTAVQTGLGLAGAVIFSVVIYAGAAQLAALNLLGVGASLPVVVGTALVINVRFLLYSASLAPHLAEQSRRRRLLAAYLLTDQAYAVSLVRFRERLDPRSRWRFYLGAGVAMWVTWQLSTVAGALGGGTVPASVPLGFAVPLAFLALLVPNVTDRPTVAAAVVSGVVAVVAAPLSGAALPVAAVSGVAAGAALALSSGRS
ncbi:MAG: AzlC family ABC transporter permease [Actinomycetota bacterium]|nr:AzlC family ABC transporter permease [Actinomycetota bacterium]